MVQRKAPLKLLLKKVASKIGVKGKLSRSDIESIFFEIELDLLEGGLALELVDDIKKHMISSLAGREFRGDPEKFVRNELKGFLVESISVGKLDLREIVERAKEERGTAVLLFFGFNGVGKSLSLVKTAKILMDLGYKPLIAAADTFRSAALEQLEGYAREVAVPLVRGDRGADPASVVYNAISKAISKGFDVVLSDTAGRRAMDRNLAGELRKIVKVSNPDLKVLVVDGLAGSDVINQCRSFNEVVPVDALVVTKVDAGGYVAAVQAVYFLKKPVLFLGVGTSIKDIKPFSPEEAVNFILD